MDYEMEGLKKPKETWEAAEKILLDLTTKLGGYYGSY